MLLEQTARELQLLSPLWGGILLAAVGLAYLVLGSRWPRLFDVLSLTVLGCTAGLQASEWVPLWQPLVIVAGGIAVGGLAALFRRVGHGVLAALVLGIIFAHLAALAVGPDGFARYLVFQVSGGTAWMPLRAPDLSCDPVLAAGLAGLVVGAAVAVLRFPLSERLATSAQGAAVIVLAGVHIVEALQAAPGSAPLADRFPLTLAAAWVCLSGVGLAAQRAVTGPLERGEPSIEPRLRQRED
jgi:hypothetical protein